MASNLVTSDNGILYEEQTHALFIKKAPEETGLARRKKLNYKDQKERDFSN